MKYKAVFFDLDGTLMDTSEGVYAGGFHAMKELGLPVVDPDLNRFIGPPIMDCFDYAFGVKDRETQKKLADAYHRFYYETGYRQAKMYPGIPEILAILRKRGYKLGIASMKNEVMVKAMAEYFDFGKCFDIMLGLDEDGKTTKADLLSKGFTHLGLKPSECVLVGDTVYDYEGAGKAGCDCICVNWGFGFTKDRKGSISSAWEILELV